MDTGEIYYRRYLDGEENAFDGVLTLYFDNLVFFLNRYVQDMQAAEDLAMDSFLELLIHPTRYHFKTSLKTYLFAIGRNKALNYLKKRKRIRRDEPYDAEAATPDLAEAFLDSEEKRELHRAIASLPDDMRTAVHLVYFEGFSYEETAKAMKVSKKQVDNLLYRAKNSLKHELKREVSL
jgi:RNA polymerase sigma-70 factor (ECF subfamily)